MGGGGAAVGAEMSCSSVVLVPTGAAVWAEVRQLAQPCHISTGGSREPWLEGKGADRVAGIKGELEEGPAG